MKLYLQLMNTLPVTNIRLGFYPGGWHMLARLLECCLSMVVPVVVPLYLLCFVKILWDPGRQHLRKRKWRQCCTWSVSSARELYSYFMLVCWWWCSTGCFVVFQKRLHNMKVFRMDVTPEARYDSGKNFPGGVELNYNWVVLSDEIMS